MEEAVRILSERDACGVSQGSSSGNGHIDNREVEFEVSCGLEVRSEEKGGLQGDSQVMLFIGIRIENREFCFGWFV